MISKLTYLLAGAASLAVVGGSIVGFGHLSESAPAKPHAAATSAHAQPARALPAAERRAPRAPGRASTQLLASPFTAEQISELVGALAEANDRTARRLAEIASAEEAQSERAAGLGELERELAAIRAQLEERERELRARCAELDRDAEVLAEREEAGWAHRALLFERGDPVRLAQRLLAYAPEDAARILAHLAPDRVRTLLACLGGADGLRYASALRSAGP